MRDGGKSRLSVYARVVLLILCFTSMISCANSETTYGDKNIAPPMAADQVMENVQEIVNHGDLGDVDFFSKKLGVVMKGDATGLISVPDRACGPAATLAPNFSEQTVGQYLYFHKIPFYFDEYYGRRPDCSRPYVKKNEKSGAVSIWSMVHFNQKEMCIPWSSVEKYFPSGKYSEFRRALQMSWGEDVHGSIAIKIISTWQGPRCVSSIEFSQYK